MQQVNKLLKTQKFNTLKTKVNISEKKIPDVTALIHINQFNTDKQNMEKKMEIKKTDNDAKTRKENNNNKSLGFNYSRIQQLDGENFTASLKQENVATKNNIADLVKNRF